MTETDRSGFYTGFVADHYDLLVPEDEGGSYVFFENVIREAGGPALELACGTGRPILAFRSKGLDVEGIDSSADMLERCRRKAREMGVEVALHEQRMESFELDRRFRTVFVVSGSFMLLPDDESVLRSLRAIHRHLEPGGRVYLAMHLPALGKGFQPGRDWVVNRKATREDGKVAQCLARLARFDEAERVFETTLRYQLLDDGEVEYEEDRDFLLHWHTQPQFPALLEEAGFEDVRALRDDGEPSEPDDHAFNFVGRRPETA